jgi:RNA recognition motif-containing protein
MTESNTELTAEDLKAVEDVKARLKFFFSDANIRQDFFIRKQLMNDRGDLAHMVAIESLLRFNTIKQHTTKSAVVAKAAKELSDLLTVSSNETAIGRVNKFTKEMMDGHIAKSLHLKNLPLKKKEGDDDNMEYAVSVSDIRARFEKYGEIAVIKLKWSAQNPEDTEQKNEKKYDKKKYPTGCALVEFETEDALNAAAEATVTSKDGETVEPTDKIVFGEEEVQIMPLAEIVKNKGGNKRKQTDDGADDDEDVEVKTFKCDWKPGCVIKLKGVPVDCDREALLDVVAAGMGITVEEVKDRKIYVDYSRGEKDGAIRFPEFGDFIANICKKLSDGTLEVKGAKVEEARTIDGDEEKKYWDDFIAFKNRQIKQRADEKRSHDKRSRSKKQKR